jgi:hypothetical protein
VRLALASETYPDPEVIAALAADTDLMVAGTARWQQDRLDPGGPRTSIPQAVGW